MIQIKLLRSVSALTWLSFLAAAAAQSWHDDSRYVSLGRRTGYYIVRPGSSLFHQLGLEGAPISDTADPFHHGHGSDALVFRFDRGGQLLTAPAYVAQAQVNNFYTLRLGSFIRGKSTAADEINVCSVPQNRTASRRIHRLPRDRSIQSI